MSAEQLELSLTQFSNALDRFKEALDEDMESNPLAVDGAIQRFEFCYELGWKTLKRFLAEQKVEAAFPREVLRQAYKYKVIDSEDVWNRMLKDRNLTVYTYKEDLALEIYNRLLPYYEIMRKLEQKLKNAD
ncbi:MAG: HI0074 family nucleotidyltransferase substrate-binding subunit [Bdellovibrionales bacterium]